MNVGNSINSFVSGLNYIEVTLTNAQIKALHGTPVTIVPAQGAGKMICLVGPIYTKFIYGGSNVFTAGAAQTINLYYGTTISHALCLTNGAIIASASSYTANITQNLPASAITVYENVALNAYNPSATEITGNAANDNTIAISVMYYVVSL